MWVHYTAHNVKLLWCKILEINHLKWHSEWWSTRLPACRIQCAIPKTPRVHRDDEHYFILPWHAWMSVISKAEKKQRKERKTCISVSSAACDVCEKNI